MTDSHSQARYQRRDEDGSGTAVSIREMVLDHERDLEALKTFVAEVRGAFNLMRIVMGASLLSAVVSIIGIVLAVTHAVTNP